MQATVALPTPVSRIVRATNWLRGLQRLLPEPWRTRRRQQQPQEPAVHLRVGLSESNRSVNGGKQSKSPTGVTTFAVVGLRQSAVSVNSHAALTAVHLK